MSPQRRPNQRGQAMVELALMTPLLVSLLAASAFFGYAITVKQQLAMAARHAARTVAIESTNGGTRPGQGNASGQEKNEYVANLGRDRFLTLAKSMLPSYMKGRLDVEPPSWRGPLVALSSPYAALYTRTAPKSGFTVGCLFYGCTLKYRLTELNWLATLMGLRFKAPGGQAGGLELWETCVMPGELPLRGSAGRAFGIYDLNRALLGKATASIDAPPYKDMQLVKP